MTSCSSQKRTSQSAVSRKKTKLTIRWMSFLQQVGGMGTGLGSLGQQFVPSSFIGLVRSGRPGLRTSDINSDFVVLSYSSRLWVHSIFLSLDSQIPEVTLGINSKIRIHRVFSGLFGHPYAELGLCCGILAQSPMGFTGDSPRKSETNRNSPYGVPQSPQNIFEAQSLHRFLTPSIASYAPRRQNRTWPRKSQVRADPTKPTRYASSARIRTPYSRT